MKLNQVCWTTKDGRTIPVDDLSESHAKNILKMLIRNQNKNQSSVNHYSSTEGKWDLAEVDDYDEYIENDMAADYVDGR
jgi:hypothetical protein